MTIGGFGRQPKVLVFTTEETEKGKGRASIITATNVFAHVPNLYSVMKGIDILLEDKGVFISESHYLLDLIKTLQYDSIYHEHLK